MFLKTDRDRPTLTATDLSKRQWLFAVRCSFAAVVVFALFMVFFAVFHCFLMPFVLCRSRIALGSLILRDVGHEHATQHPDFVNDAVLVKLWTVEPGSRHNDFCIAYLLDFIFRKLVSVLKCFAEALGCVILCTKLVDGVHFVNVQCTHDSGISRRRDTPVASSTKF